MTAPNGNPGTPLTPPSSTSEAPSSGTNASLQQTGFRYTAETGVPDYLVGRDAKQTAELVRQLYEQNQKLVQGIPSPTPGAAPPPTYQTQTTTVAPPTDEDFLNNPAKATKQYADYLAATQFQPRLQAQASTLAQQAKELVAMRRTDDFRRWGPEIDLMLQQVAPDPTTWTPQNINYVVDMVRGRHVEDLLAEERAKTQNPLGGAAARPDGSGMGTSLPASHAVDLQQLPPNYAAALKRLNVEQRDIDEFLVRTYVAGKLEPTLEKARERWTKQAMRGDVVTDGKEFLSGVYANG